MTWIKDIKGDILNTDYVCGVFLYTSIDSTCEVITMKEPGFNESVLFQGTEEECKEYMDKLMRDLNGELSYEEEYARQLDKERALAQHKALYDASKLSEGDTFRLYPNGPLQRCVKADRKVENMPYILFEEAK